MQKGSLKQVRVGLVARMYKSNCCVISPTDMEIEAPTPLCFHTCLSTADVTLDPYVEELLLDESPANFEAWLHSQLYRVAEDYNQL